MSIYPSSRRSVSLVLALLGLALPGAAGAAIVRAEVETTLFGTFLGDGQTGSGATAVTAAKEFVQGPPAPYSARLAGTSHAAVGEIGATATVTLDGPGEISGQVLVVSEAEFRDRWLFTDRPLDTPGKLRATIGFDGDVRNDSLGTTVSSFGRLDLSFLSLAEFDNVLDTDGAFSGPVQHAAEVYTIELDFLYGRPVVVEGLVYVRVDLTSSHTLPSVAADVDAQFGNTARITALEVQDALGTWTTSYALTTDSGGRYPFQPVPEPASIVLVLGGLLVLARRRRPL